jgi:glycosyltransferase involved in cell wall biosynthesis
MISVSVVTPSFNQGRFIEQTVRSVLDQGVPVEYIVIDGGSKDESASILQRYAPRVAYWHSRPDKGQTDALNQGLARVSGDIVGWINSDDYYLPGAFRAVIERFSQPDRPDVVFGNAVTVDEVGRFLRENRHGTFSLTSLASLGMDVNQQALFWRRELNDKVVPLDVSMRFCMDLELLVKMGLAGARFARIGACLGAFRLHGNSKTSTLDDVRLKEQARLLAPLQAGRSAGRVARAAASLRRRAEIAADGGLKYALLGGTYGASAECLRALDAAALWAVREGT